MKEILISPQFWAIVIPALVAIWTFSKTKAAERESEWRKEKLKLYLKFVQTLSSITESDITDEGEIIFANACNDLHALASSDVLKALHKYQDEIRITNTNSSNEQRQKSLDSLIYEMRKDLKIKPLDKKDEFQMLLWTSGKKKNKTL
jgi:hypothetical protein